MIIVSARARQEQHQLVGAIRNECISEQQQYQSCHSHNGIRRGAAHRAPPTDATFTNETPYGWMGVGRLAARGQENSGPRSRFMRSLIVQLALLVLVALASLPPDEATAAHELNAVLSIGWSGPNPCAWPGITCASGNAHISVIDLRSRGLRGSIDSNVCVGMGESICFYHSFYYCFFF